MFYRLLWPWRFFRKRSRRGKIIIIIVLLILGLGARQLFGTESGPEYELEAARLDDLTEKISETGNVTTAGAAPVYSTTTGIVDQVFVQNGSQVTKGKALFSVKAIATKQEQDSALAAYLAAKNTLESAKASQLSLQAAMFGKWDAFKELAESDEYEDADGNPRTDQRNQPEFSVPEKEWLAAEAVYKNQQQVVSQAGVAASAAWEAYQATQDSQVVAIFDGEVRNVSIAPGDSVTIKSASANQVPALLVVDTLVKPTVKLNVSETDITKLEPGQKAVVSFDALPNQTFSGQVDRVDTWSAPINSVVNYAVYVSLDDFSDQIRGGMTADVDITVSEKKDILTVPTSAVKPYNGGRAVRVVDENGEIKFIPVETGSKGDGRTEIVSGIEAGTEVIVALSNDQVQRSGGFF